MCLVDLLDIHEAHMSPALNRSSLQTQRCLKIREGIIFDFYTGLPHMYVINEPMWTAVAILQQFNTPFGKKKAMCKLP